MTEDLKKAFLAEALSMLSIYGWGAELINNIEEQTGYNNIFSSTKNLVTYHLEQNDHHMLNKLEEMESQNLKVREKIKQALLIRFDLHDYAVTKETAKYLMMPKNSDLAVMSLAKSCDKIWVFAGDQSTDFNYYTKRTLLGAVYSASVVFYLKRAEDDNFSNKDLESFIEARIADTLKLGAFKAKVKDKITALFTNCKRT